MKTKLAIACSVALALVACSKDNPTTSTTAASDSQSGPTKVAQSLKGLTYELKGDKFVKKDVSNKAKYYLVYFSASW